MQSNQKQPTRNGRRKSEPLRICFVTGTRAEFGLMQSVLKAIAAHTRLQLQLVVTGMHLDSKRGKSINQIRKQGWAIDAVIPWKQDETSAASVAMATGHAVAKLAECFSRLRSDVVLVVGDRVEAFAAASAAHISRIVLAHVHGGDRAQGQIDDSLRHAISKLAHLHFPATRDAADRLLAMGEDPWRITIAGSPGLDGIGREAASWNEIQLLAPGLAKGKYALLVLHPTDSDVELERHRALVALQGTLEGGARQGVIIGPNNDPGSQGIVAAWEGLVQLGEDEPGMGEPDLSPARAKHIQPRKKSSHTRQRAIDAESISGEIFYFSDLPRRAFLGLMKHAAVMVGNSSSGIIEAASFGRQVVDIGPRQAGRLRGENVRNVPAKVGAIARAVGDVLGENGGKQVKNQPVLANIYGDGKAAKRIVARLAGQLRKSHILEKLIAF